MHHGHGPIEAIRQRRAFLVAGGLGFLGLHLPSLKAAPAKAMAARRHPARSTILIWLSGGLSHLDTFDLKPSAPVEYRGEFKGIATSAPGVRVCEHLPLTARQAHHLAVINSLGHFNRGTGDHHAGYYYNLTGREPDPSFRQLLNNRKPLATDWPFMGSVVAVKRPAHPYLPSLISLPLKPGAPEYTRPGQFAARLGMEYDAAYLLGKVDRPLEFVVPVLSLEGDVGPERLADRRRLLRAVDDASRKVDRSASVPTWSKQQEKAFALLGSAKTKGAFDLTREPAALRDRYGASMNAMSFLMARRLVEAEVPFVAVFWQEYNPKTASCPTGAAWDTHHNNFGCLRDALLPEFDRAFAALLDDLHQRGLLERTLVLVTSEMGRQPKVGDPRSAGQRGAGRDHWTHCMTTLLAGGGIRGGRTYGSSDKVGAYPADKPVAPEDVARTLYHAMGIDDMEAHDREGKPFNLLPEGRVLGELF